MAALRSWLQAAQWQRHTRTTLLRCITWLRTRVRVLQARASSYLLDSGN